MEKLLPQNIEAECGVLGSIIIDPDAIVQVADFLFAEDFYRDAHRTIYEVITLLYEQHEPADFITICDELERRNKLDEVGGPAYITSLINQVPTSGNVEYYGRIVERMAILRRLIHAAGQIAAVAYEESDAEAALDKAEQLIFTISQRHARADFSALRELLSDYMEKLDQLHEHRGSIVGVPTGFTDLDRLTGGLQKSDLIILAARPAMGKCVAWWTLIDDPLTGERITIQEGVRRHMTHVLGLPDEGKIRSTAISHWVDSGIQPCYRVQTRLGRKIDVTGHHPFLTVQGWQPLHDLSVGQRIAVPTSIPIFGNDDSLPLDKVRLLAYFIAEGGLTNSSPAFTNTDPIIVEDFKHIITTHFPACAIRQQRITYTVAQQKSAYTQRGIAILPANPVTAWLKELGLMGKLAKDKFFPACVWQWNRLRLAEFIRAIMSCDGCIYSFKGVPIIEFTVASKQLAEDMYHALLRFGIVAKYCQKGQNVWRVEITSPESVQKYQREIGWIGEKTHRFAQYEHVITSRGGNYGHAPKEVWLIIRADAQQQGLSLTKLAYKSGQTTKQGKYAGYKAHTQKGVSRTRLSAFADTLDNPALRFIASPDIYWDEITSIEHIGEHKVYDLTVPDGANFVAQDIYVHNTSLALSLAHNSAIQHKQSIAVFSLEMSKEQLVQRILSMDAGVDQQRLRTGWIEDEEWERIIYSMGTLSEANIWIEDTAGISTTEMRSKARRLQAEHGVDLIIVDYLQLMQSTVNGIRNKNREQEISEISRNLKGLARELNVPVVALAQLSRAVESRQSKVPQLSDLRESGCLTGDTLIYLPDEGIYKPIEQLVGMSFMGIPSSMGIRVLALNPATWQLEPRRVTNAFTTGCKPVYRMTTRLGRTIRATANHKFLTLHGWQRLDELPVGAGVAAVEGWGPSGSPALANIERLVPVGAGVDDEEGWGPLRSPIAINTAYPSNAHCVPRIPVGAGVDVDEGWGPSGSPVITWNGLVGYVSAANRIRYPHRRATQRVPTPPPPHPRPYGNGCTFDEDVGIPYNGNEGNVYWDEIVSIEPDGEAEVYDLTVDVHHNFVASELIVHNSIEQDADIVMFIYRDDVYNPDSERKNIADIIIAKHRNGPVGEISLYFQASQTRFRDLEATPPAE